MTPTDVSQQEVQQFNLFQLVWWKWRWKHSLSIIPVM